MLLKVIRKTFFGICSLPRSGSTLLANIFDSIDNSFCVVEPILAATNDSVTKVQSTYRVGEYRCLPPQNIIPTLRNVLNNSKYDIGSIKETFRFNDKRTLEWINKDCDFLVWIDRDPLSTFSGWKKVNWGVTYNDVYFFLYTYKAAMDAKKKVIIPTYTIIYEDLCKDPVGHINKVLGERIIIGGDFKLTGAFDSIGYGCHLGKKAGDIKSARVSTECLNQKEIDIIRKELYT